MAVSAQTYQIRWTICSLHAAPLDWRLNKFSETMRLSRSLRPKTTIQQTKFQGQMSNILAATIFMISTRTTPSTYLFIFFGEYLIHHFVPVLVAARHFCGRSIDITSHWRAFHQWHHRGGRYYRCIGRFHQCWPTITNEFLQTDFDFHRCYFEARLRFVYLLVEFQCQVDAFIARHNHTICINFYYTIFLGCRFDFDGDNNFLIRLIPFVIHRHSVWKFGDHFVCWSDRNNFVLCASKQRGFWSGFYGLAMWNGEVRLILFLYFLENLQVT